MGLSHHVTWETNDATPGARLRYLGVDRDEELLRAAQARLETMAAPELQAGQKAAQFGNGSYKQS